MANLPTAYASQGFGRKTLDFYAVEGDVVGADPRARSEERRLEDFDGQRHTVRLMEKGFELEPGHTATVLRMQPGPARRSRPVAVVNHDTGSWCRTHPGAEGLLAKAGVARTLNWALTMVLFALAALALVWPFLRTFLVEVDPGLFGAAPAFNIAELAVAALPSLAGWSFSELVAPLTGPLGGAVPALAPMADMLVFGSGVMIAALGVYLLRSWRLLWAPLFVGSLGAVALGYGGVSGMVEPALSGLGLASLLFLVGGLINRIRDGARLEARIAVLSDHLLRQGPQNAVVAPEVEVEAEAEVEPEAPANDDVDPVVPLTAATAAMLRELGDGEAGEEVEVEADEVAEVVDEAEPAEVAEAVEAAEAPDAVDAVEAEDAPQIDDEATAAIEAGTAEAIPEAEAVGDQAELQPETEVEAETAVEPEAEVEADAEVEAVEDASSEAEPAAEPAEQGVAEVAADPVEATDEAAPAVEEELADAAPVAEASEVEAPDHVLETSDAPEPADAADEPAPEPPVRPTPDLSAAPAGLDPEEAERLRTDPRYASRAIVLPPPPPMPTQGKDLGEGSGEAVGQGTATTLRPSAPLPGNVIPIFATPPAPAETSADDDAPTETDPA